MNSAWRAAQPSAALLASEPSTRDDRSIHGVTILTDNTRAACYAFSTIADSEGCALVLTHVPQMCAPPAARQSRRTIRVLHQESTHRTPT
jgi:hypothetical protein